MTLTNRKPAIRALPPPPPLQCALHRRGGPGREGVGAQSYIAIRMSRDRRARLQGFKGFGAGSRAARAAWQGEGIANPGTQGDCTKEKSKFERSRSESKGAACKRKGKSKRALKGHRGPDGPTSTHSQGVTGTKKGEKRGKITTRKWATAVRGVRDAASGAERGAAGTGRNISG